MFLSFNSIGASELSVTFLLRPLFTTEMLLFLLIFTPARDVLALQFVNCSLMFQQFFLLRDFFPLLLVSRLLLLVPSDSTSKLLFSLFPVKKIKIRITTHDLDIINSRKIVFISLVQMENEFRF